MFPAITADPSVCVCVTELNLPALPSGLASDGNQGPEPAPWLLAVGWTENLWALSDPIRRAKIVLFRAV